MPTTVVPNPLFHYSSLPDLKAVLVSQSLTLRQVDSTDDLNAALSFIQNVIINEYPALQANYFNLDNASAYPIFSYSLTGKNDSASLWKNFNPDGGFAYTINPAQLVAVMSANSLSLNKCLYDDDEKTSFVLDTIVNVNDPEALDPQGQMFERRIKSINRNILNYVSVLKDAYRSDEQEWRIIANYQWAELLGGPTDPPDQLSLPVLSGSTGPHVAVPLISGPYTTMGIEQMVIGPHADMAQAMADCQALIASYSLPYVVITESGLPYP